MKNNKVWRASPVSSTKIRNIRKGHENKNNRQLNQLALGKKGTNFSIPVCDEQVRVNLNGIRDNFSFMLFRLINKKAVICYECANREEVVRGTITNVGTDFVEIKKEDQSFLTIMRERLISIKHFAGKSENKVKNPTRT